MTDMTDRKKYTHSAVMAFTFRSAMSQEDLLADPEWAQELLVSAARVRLEMLNDQPSALLTESTCAFRLVDEWEVETMPIRLSEGSTRTNS
jgi:hypothetical protein